MSEVVLAAAVRDWYRDRVEGFLRRESPDKVTEFDPYLARLDRLTAARGEALTICFLGQAGVGKSTLINTVVGGAQFILPAGGIGTLTAQATCVKYAPSPYFQVEYQSVLPLNQLVFGLEKHREAELRRQGQKVPSTDELSGLLTTESHASIERDVAAALGEHDEKIDAQGTSERFVEQRKQAHLLVRGQQDGDTDIAYLLDCLRAAMGHKPRWGNTPQGGDVGRIERIRGALALAKSGNPYKRELAGSKEEFFAELKLHSAGYLAPLIKTLEVGWDADVLRDGVQLVDLPGIGIANDTYRGITHKWIRSAKAVVLVVDRAGITQESARLLHDSEFLNKTLHSGLDEGDEMSRLMVVAVKLDQTAQEEYDRIASFHDGVSEKPWGEYFATACDGMKERIRNDLGEMIRQRYGEQTGAGADGAREVMRRLLDQMQVFPVSSLQYRYVLARHKYAELDTLEATGVPTFAAALRQVCLERNLALDSRLRETRDGLRGKALAVLQQIEEQCREDTRAAEEAESLRRDLEEVLIPLREEFARRQGDYRRFVKSEVPERIRREIAEAALPAQREILKYLKRLDGAHWATLRASIRGHGRWRGAQVIDLPHDFALVFEGQVATVWSQQILGHIRKETKALADDYIRMVEDIAVWARAQGTRVRPALVEALRDELKGDAQELVHVGKDVLDDLRVDVQQKLFERLISKIQSRCETFAEEKRHLGPGTKVRILEFFRELVDDVIEASRTIAQKILVESFERKVVTEIEASFKRLGNPLQRASEQIVESHERRIQREQDKRRPQILADVEQVLALVPRDSNPN